MVAGRNLSRNRQGLQSGEDFFVHVVVEPDNHRLAFFDRWRAEIAGWPQHQFCQFRFAWFLLVQIQLDDPFSLGDIQFCDARQQCQGRRSVQPRFLGVDFFACRDSGCRKKLLRFSAGLSSRTVVAPINVRHEFAPDSKLIVGTSFKARRLALAIITHRQVES